MKLTRHPFKKEYIIISAIILVAVAAVLITVVSCSSSNEKKAEDISFPSQTTMSSVTVPSSEENKSDPVYTLTETQLNSVNMLNWLAYLTQDINAQKDNRLYLEEVYSQIVNETYPNSVDYLTQSQLGMIRYSIDKYRMIDVKRDRIQYFYEQSKAQNIKNAIPSPMALLSLVESSSPADLITSVVYMVADSVSGYIEGSSAVDQAFLVSGWELDDEADEVFQNLRSDAFDYMIEITREYSIPGNLALNEKAVDEFVIWKNEPNLARKIQFFESNKETYQAFGSYWLVLAECYYENEDYGKCLDAIHSYEALDIRIFRKDTAYAKVLPMVIASAENTMAEGEYILFAEDYADRILANIGTNDWAMRYYAAQVYIQLYTKTGDSRFLDKAYAAALDNVNYLIQEQLTLNDTYVNALKEEPVPAGSTEEQEDQIEMANELNEKRRETELPPVYEPLLLNCELLFAIAEKQNIPDAEKQRIDNILHPNGNPLFLVEELDHLYRYNNKIIYNGIAPQIPNRFGVYKDRLYIPVYLVADRSEITVTATDQDGNTIEVFDDWKIDEVKRENEGDISTFTVKYTSEKADDFSFDPGMKVKISIVPYSGYNAETLEAEYDIVTNKPNWYNRIEVWEDDLTYVRTK